jgi:hypothetical protein
MATRVQTQQTSAPARQAQPLVERSSKGERGLNRCYLSGGLARIQQCGTRRAGSP